MDSTGRQRIGLALSGGAARGPAHIGVLSVLEREGIPIDCVAGTSVGALIGALYCAGLGSERLQEIAAHMGWRQLTRVVCSSQGLVSFSKMERWLVEWIGDLKFADLLCPFAVVATDLRTGLPVTLREGRLATAVQASCAVPGWVVPVAWDGRLLVDGGVSRNLPVETARELGADYVMGVDLMRPALRRRWGPLGIGLAALEMLVRRSGGGLGTADCLISPDLAGASYFRFDQYATLIDRGVCAAEAQLPVLRAVLGAGNTVSP